MLILNQRGDSIIEVLLAITVFSLVSVGAMTIMNQGTNASQRALEMTHVRQQIDAQAEAIRALQYSASAGYAAAWGQVAQNTSTGHYYDEESNATRCPSNLSDLPTGSFILNPTNASIAAGSTWYKNVNEPASLPYAQVKVVSGSVESTGMWIEREYDTAGALPDLYTFTINACWNAAGMTQPSKLETVVRLYDPGT